MKNKLTIITAIILCFSIAFTLNSCESKTSSESSQSTSFQSSEVIEKTGKRVYFAGPLFSEGEKNFNEEIAGLLEAHGYDVFLPQRDGLEAAVLEGKSQVEIADMIFDKDTSEIEKADIIFMNLDGRVPDEGACVELGIAYAKGKRCYGFKTDTRALELNLDINPMISECFIKLFENYDGDELAKEIEKYLDENEL